MKKQVLSAFMLLMAFLGANQCLAQKLVLLHADKTTTDIELNLQPRVTFEGNKLMIRSTVLDMEFPKEDVLRFTYEGSSTGIELPSNKSSYSIENEKIVFHGINGNDKISVYSVNGLRVPVNITFSGSDATLPVSAIPNGVYILNVNGRTSKFMKQ